MRYSRGQSTRHSIGYSVWSTPLATPWPCCVPSKTLLASSWFQPCVHPLAGPACPLGLYLDIGKENGNYGDCRDYREYMRII